jgi:hypothetical protein
MKTRSRNKQSYTADVVWSIQDRWCFYSLLVLLQYHLAVGDIITLTAIQFITTFSLMCATCRSPCTKWDHKCSGEIRPQLGARKLDRQVQQRKKFGWNTYRECRQKELPSNWHNQPIERRDVGRPRRARNGITSWSLADDEVASSIQRNNY